MHFHSQFSHIYLSMGRVETRQYTQITPLLHRAIIAKIINYLIILQRNKVNAAYNLCTAYGFCAKYLQYIASLYNYSFTRESRRVPKGNIRMDHHAKTKADAELDLNWCLGTFSCWMRVIGIHEAASNINKKKKYWRWFAWFIQRWTFLFLSIGINILMLVSFYRNEKDKKRKSTFLWNEWMDYILTSIHSISIHLCLLIFVIKNWNNLNMAMNEVEYCLIDSRSDRVYPRLRNMMSKAVIAVVLMVNN